MPLHIVSSGWSRRREADEDWMSRGEAWVNLLNCRAYDVTWYLGFWNLHFLGSGFRLGLC